MRGLLEKRGRLSEQLDSLAADRRMASKQLDLAVLEKRLQEAIHRWQVLAATCRTLDAIRESISAASPAGDVAGGVDLSRPADAKALPAGVDALG